MPCTDGGVPFPPSREEVLHAKVPVPMLCALLTVLKADGQLQAYVNDIDWKQAGITESEFQEWWRIHKAQDAARRQRELAETLPPGDYAVRQEITHNNRHWFVTAVIVDNGVKTVAMVTADERQPHLNRRFKVRKS